LLLLLWVLLGGAPRWRWHASAGCTCAMAEGCPALLLLLKLG
jgi:hypothetical protein